MKKMMYLVSVFLFAFSITIAQDAEMPPEAATLYNEGNKLLKSGDYNGAISKFDGAIKLSQDYRIYYQKSIALKKQRKYQEAEGALQKCIDANPSFAQAYNGMVTNYYALGEYQKAIDNFKKFQETIGDAKLAKKADQYIGLSYTKLGQTAKSNGSYDDAIAHLQEAVNHYDYDAAYLFLAEIFVETGEFSQALEAADKAINNRASNSKISKGAPYYYKGLAFKGMNDNAKAKENFEVAVKDAQYKGVAQHELNLMK